MPRAYSGKQRGPMAPATAQQATELTRSRHSQLEEPTAWATRIDAVPVHVHICTYPYGPRPGICCMLQGPRRGMHVPSAECATNLY